MSMITITVGGCDLRARQLPGDEDWRDAAARAIRRRFGQGASAWCWTLESWQQRPDGSYSSQTFRATIVGALDVLGGHPVLGRATYTHEVTQ